MDLSSYTAGSIRKIMTTAYLNVLSNPREARFVSRMQRVIGKAERRRKECLEKEGLEVPPFLIASITVTTENYHEVTSKEFLSHLASLGCKLVFYVEYVPFDESTEPLSFRDEHVAEMEQILEERREQYKEMVFLSFPGDEKALDGCMAAGRGFFHIGPDGSAEPCPFSPFSDRNVVRTGLRDAIASPLFRRIRDARALGWEHTGGCTLYEHRDEVKAFITPSTSASPSPLSSLSSSF